VADHLASVGRLDRAAVGVPDRPPPSREASGAEEATFWRDGLEVEGCADRVRGRTVLLVVDATSSLWPVTVAAAALRRVGAAEVLPLLLHRRP
jgi:ATP-dependent DNA helicase RecQ